MDDLITDMATLDTGMDIPHHRTGIMALPPEITERYVSLLDPADAAAFAQTCKRNHWIIYESADQFIWRALFCNTFDDPRELDNGDALVWQAETCAPNLWRTELLRRMYARHCLRALTGARLVQFAPEADFSAPRFATVSPDSLGETLRTLSHIVDTARRTPRSEDESDIDFVSRNMLFLERELSGSAPMRAFLHQMPKIPALLQLAAKLHVLHGLAGNDLTTVRGRGLARERVYLLANYKPANRYGPYLSDGMRRPDWEHLEAIQMVVGRNVQERKDEWRIPEEDMPVFGFRHAQPYSVVHPPNDIVEGDWAGVTGKWYRVVCFCDYRDLWTFNFAVFGVQVGQRPHLDEYNEAVRLMTLDLRIVSIGEPPESLGISGAKMFTPPQHAAPLPALETLEEELDLPSTPLGPSSPSSSFSSSSPASSFFHSGSPASSSSSVSSSPTPPKSNSQYPTLWFAGTVQSPDIWHPTSFVHGRVERSADGTVLWKLTSNYENADRWVCEGVQIGGVKSRAGVLGIWSDVEHDAQGPAGPSWFWKAQSTTDTGLPIVINPDDDD